MPANLPFRAAVAVVFASLLAACSSSMGSRGTLPPADPPTSSGGAATSLTYSPQFNVYPVPPACPASNPQLASAIPPLAVNPSGTEMWWFDDSRGTYQLANGVIQGCLPGLTFKTQDGTTIYGGNRMAYDTNGLFYALATDSARTEYYLVSNALNPSSAIITPVEPGSEIQNAFDIEATPSNQLVFGQNTNLIVVDNAATSPHVNSYTLPDGADCVAAITSSENGNMYIGTCASQHYIFKYSQQMTLQGSVPLPNAVQRGAIAPDPRGGVWFVLDTNYALSDEYAYVAPDGTLKTYNTPQGVRVSAAATARDGSVWLAGQTDSGAEIIAQVNTSTGQLTSYPLPTSVDTPAAYLRGTYANSSCTTNALYWLGSNDQIVTILL